MSINVTVTGNPVSIKRGKMVTCDPNHGKKEFERRRLMRLEQVRQQSKDIAEDVRNKVRKEKKKQMNQIEEEGKEKLRNWQNRKLLELQTQYKEALRELGTGHKQAEELQEEGKVLAEQDEYNKGMASHRSRVAATHLQMEKEKKQLKKSVPIQKKKIVRDIENTRASLISNMKKKKKEVSESTDNKRKKRSADINITIPGSDSDSDEDGKDATEGYSESIEEVENVYDFSEDSEKPREPLVTNKYLDSKCPFQENLRDFSPDIDSGKMSPAPRDTGKKFVEYFHEAVNGLPKQPPVDTRISDRIKRRDIMASQPDYCDIAAETQPTPFVESNTKIREAIDSRYFRKSPEPRGTCTCGKGQTICSPSCGKRYIEEDIPIKPPVKLVETDAHLSKDTLQSNDPQKMQYYDHPNRFSQEKLVSGKSRVEKIPTESLEVIPNVQSEAEWQEKIRQRDREARIRGQKALEKERIQRDYEDMMKKLPLLQKKERISQITRDKPKYHMDEGRLKEKERERQNKLDNAYSKLFPKFKPAIVTLPKSRQPETNIKTIVDEEPVQSLNVGKWDVDHDQKMFTAEEVQEIVRAFTEQQKPKDRQAKLKELLKSLKLQKKQLLEEIKSLPKDDSINQLINDLNSFSDSDEKIKTSRKDKSQRKRRREDNEKEISTDSSTESSSSQTKENKPKQKQHPEPTKVPTPRKKAKLKSRKKVLILQNMSTQTTPKVNSSSEDRQSDKVKQYPTCSKLHVACDCNKENEEGTEDLCHIFIKLTDKETPEVFVKSKEKETKAIGEKLNRKRITLDDKIINSKSVAVGTDEIKEKPVEKEINSPKISNKVTQTSSTVETKKSSSKKSESKSRTNKSETRKTTTTQVDSSETKSKSWKEQLSKNSVSTSSTSYYSPPDFENTKDLHLLSSTTISSKQSFYNLHKKPQQGNLHELSAAGSISQSQSSFNGRTIHPGLLRYIKKLLIKSRGSIDNLTVSSSNVQTPSQSIIEVESNNPLDQLHGIIKYFNMKTEDIARELSYSPDLTPPHYNTSASSPEMYQVDDKTKKTTSTGSGKETSLNSVTSVDSISLQYADITDSCSRRIATLATMINQIREEKIRMLNNCPGVDDKSRNLTSSDRDHSTAYLDLPESKESSKHSSLNSLDDDELHRRLIEIDFSLARKLRKFSPVQEEIIKDKKAEATGTSKDTTDESCNTDQELWNRLRRLKQQDIQEPPPVSPKIESNKENNAQFVPFLLDIPKLPILEIQTDSDNSNHKRPPPSKGLKVAKKFNGEISLVPHELSTIIEADSQLSTKVGSTQVSPNTSKTSITSSPRKDFQLLVRTKENEETQTSYHSVSSKSNDVTDMVTKVTVTSKKSPGKQVETEKSKESSGGAVSPLNLSNLSYDVSSKSIVLDGSGTKSTVSSKKSIVMSSSSSDDLETVEAMLKSIGMEWAIPTLHKTQEALALTSSSSSLDFSSKKTTNTNESGGSEISLKEYLKKQVLNKVSSSTLRSDTSPASLLSEFSELSSILVSSRERKDNQRTSTPLTASKSTSKSRGSEKRVVFSEDSDISSVRDESRKLSNKYSFYSLSEQE